MKTVSVQSILAVVLLLLVAGVAAGRAPALGETYLEEPEAKGTLGPAARPLDDSGLVRTLDSAAIVHLDNGQVLKLAANSSARFAGTSGGAVEVKVLSGRVFAIGNEGRVRRAGAGASFLLAPTYEDPLAAETRLLAEDDYRAVGRRDLEPRAREAAAERPAGAAGARAR